MSFQDVDRQLLHGVARPFGEAEGRVSHEPSFAVLLDQLAAISNYTLDCIYVLDHEWRFCHLNRLAFQEIAQERDLIGMVIWDAFPDAIEILGGPYIEVMLSAAPTSFEIYYPPLNGWYEIQATPLCGGLHVSFRNINERKLVESRLREAEERYRLAALATNDLIRDWDVEAGHIEWSMGSRSRFGYFPPMFGDIPGWWEDRIHPEDRARVVKSLAEVVGQRLERFDCHYRWRKADGSYAEVHDESYLMKSTADVPIRMVGAMQDITGERAARAEAVRDRAMLQTIIDSVPDHIFIKDREGLFVLTNRVVEQRWHLLGRHARDIFPSDVVAAFEKIERDVMRSGEARTMEEPLTIDGQVRCYQTVKVPWQQDGVVKGVIGISRDITEQKSIQDQVRWTANHDALTLLPNRAFFQTQLSQVIAAAKATGGKFSLLLVDLDHFKLVNDSAGHDAGDALLQIVADRLHESVRPGDLVARLGGDEFAIVLPGCGAKKAREIADRILHALKAPIVHRTRPIDCRASIGASVFPEHGTQLEELLKSADMALYAAKDGGRGVCMMFEEHIRCDLEKRSSMLALGREALAGEWITPYYQPKVHLRTGAIIGFEALLRLRHPQLGILAPNAIYACFDDLELAAAISDRIVERAVRDMRDWLDQGIAFGSVAVNAAAAEFRRGDFAERVLQTLGRAGVPTRCFQLEVTETVFLGRGAEYVERALKLLSQEGVKIALDDFGTGYASLRHLRQFPVDIIKIDRSFIAEMRERQEDAEIVRAVINLGQSLGMEVVAEGIENEEQACELRRMGCGYGQGFLYARAFASDQMARFIAENGANERFVRPATVSG